MNLIDRFNETLIFGEAKINNVNRGGCGVFAEKLAKKLIEYGKHPKIVLLISEDEYDEETIDTAQFILRRGDIESYKEIVELTGLIIQHIAVKYDNHYLDASGVYKNLEESGSWFYLKEAFTVDVKTLELLNVYLDWNPEFNKMIGTPLIEKFIDKVFKKGEDVLVD